VFFHPTSCHRIPFDNINRAAINPNARQPISFVIQGVTARINVLYYCPTCTKPLSYQPNGWSTLRQLNVNLLRLGGGSEGDVAHFNINNYPNEWAQNFNSFLSTANQYGIKVYFVHMGNRFGTLFGIVCPEPSQGVVGTSIRDAKTMIDALAGNNALNHNFITDPRVFGWSVANEVDISNPTTYHWVIQILDYISAKGGKAWVSAPIDSRITNAYGFVGEMDFNKIEPLLRGHVDYLEIHMYQPVIVADAIKNHREVYVTMYSWFTQLIQNLMLGEATSGSIPVDHMIIGEFGIIHGNFSWTFDMQTVDFNDTVRSDYYRAMFWAANDNGIKMICNFELWDNTDSRGGENTPAYGIIYLNGTFSGPVTIMEQFYLTLPTASGGLVYVVLGGLNRESWIGVGANSNFLTSLRLLNVTQGLLS